jgi:hypothetical protein
MKASNIKFPKRFEMEGLNPLDLKVKVVCTNGTFIFNNVQELLDERGSVSGLAGPMADMLDGVRCVRFESSEMYAKLSA